MIQSMLRRSEQDIEDLIAMKARVRLCKGAYLEPPAVAFPDKADVDRNYVRLMERLLLRGQLPWARHPRRGDHRPRARVRRRRRASPPTGSSSRCSTASGATCRSGCARPATGMRVYIPFGTQWYPYLMRRLAERPANIAFFLGNIVRESVPGR